MTITDAVPGSDDASPVRIDVALVRAGLARSRTHAAKLVAAGRVAVDGRTAVRPSTPVAAGSRLDVVGHADAREHEVDWVSRGAVKLERALSAFEQMRPPGVCVDGRRCLDAGASTGGFTEVLLARGAAHVEAVDVGHDQLAAALRTDPRVTDRSGVTVRDLSADAIGGPVDLLVADLSFISLVVVLAGLIGLVDRSGDLVVMVKPQFEVGRGATLRAGVVRDPQARRAAIDGVANRAGELGWGVHAITPSALPGPAGNQEFFLWLVAAGSETSAAGSELSGGSALSSASDGVIDLGAKSDPNRSHQQPTSAAERRSATGRSTLTGAVWAAALDAAVEVTP